MIYHTSDVPVSRSENHITVYGRTFPADQEQQAREFGVGVLTALQARHQRELSRREVYHGEVESNAPTPINVTVPKHDPDANPYLGAMALVEQRWDLNPQQKEKRSAAYALESAKWEATRAAEKQQAARAADPEFKRAKESAVSFASMFRTDPKATTDEVAAAVALAEQVETCSPGEYWQGRGAILQTYWGRLDAAVDAKTQALAAERQALNADRGALREAKSEPLPE